MLDDVGRALAGSPGGTVDVLDLSERDGSLRCVLVLDGEDDAVVAVAVGATVEVASGKLANPESSAALVPNAFGLFIGVPTSCRRWPGVVASWPPLSVELEDVARFPWAGGRHPCLDVLISCGDALVGVESKRYERCRPGKASPLSQAYWRPVWGARMRGVEQVRDGLRNGSLPFGHPDAAQLVKRAVGLRTAGARSGRLPALVYLHLEPRSWPGGRAIPDSDHAHHRAEVARFAELVAGDEVAFVHLT